MAKNVTDDIGLDLITDSLYQQISTSRIAETDVSVGLDIIAECLCAGDHVPMFMNKEKISNLFDTISYFICTYTTLYMKPTTTPATLSKHHDGIAASITLFDKAVSVDRLWNENILIRHKESLASLFDLFTFMDEDDLSPYQTEGIGSSGNNVNSPHHPLSAIVPLVKRVWDKIEYRLKALQHQNEDDFQSIIFALAHSWRRNVLMEDHIGR